MAYSRELEDGDGQALNPLMARWGMGGRMDRWPVDPGADFFVFAGCKMGSQFLRWRSARSPTGAMQSYNRLRNHFDDTTDSPPRGRRGGPEQGDRWDGEGPPSQDPVP